MIGRPWFVLPAPAPKRMSKKRRLELLAEQEWLREFVRMAEGHPILSASETAFVQGIRVTYLAGDYAYRVSDKQRAMILDIWIRTKPEPDGAWEDAQWAAAAEPPEWSDL